MGFWDWLFGKSDGGGGPVVLEAPREKPAEAPPPRAAPPAQTSIAPATPAASAKPKPKEFGIEQAIELMRKLPLDEEPELVLRVVRKTLRSTGVSLEEIIRAAKRREATLDEDVAKDRADIERLEHEIAERKARIERAIAQSKETRSVRDRLQEAIQNESVIGLVVPPEVTAAAAAAYAAKSQAPGAPSAAPPATTSAAPKPAASVAPKPKVSSPPKPPPPLPSKAKDRDKPEIPSVVPPEDTEETAKIDVEVPKAATPPEDPSSPKS